MHQYFMGSVLDYLVRFRMGGTQDANLEAVRDQLHAAYHLRGIPATNRFSRNRMKASWFHRGGTLFAELRGKAQDTKYLVGALLDVATAILDDPTRVHEVWMVMGLERLFNADEILDKHRRDPWRPPAAEHRAFSTALREFRPEVYKASKHCTRAQRRK